MKSRIYCIVNIAYKYAFCVLTTIYLTSSQVYAAKALSLRHILSTAHDFTCTYFQYDQAYEYIVNHGFSYIKDGRYYGRFLGEEYENDDNVDIIKYEGRMNGKSVLTIINRELSPDNTYPGGDWSCYRSHVDMSATNAKNTIKGTYINWGLCFAVDGSGKYYQGRTLLFPETSLTKKEMNHVVSLLKSKLKKISMHKLNEDLLALDFTIPSVGECDSYRTSLYYQKNGNNKYEILIVIGLNDDLPDGVESIPYQEKIH